jgi:multiple sugar transport system substrate-binding protein
MNRREMVLSTGAGMTGVLLAACGGAGTSQLAAQEKAAGKVLFLMSDFAPDVAVRKPQADAFNARYPKTQVEIGHAPAGSDPGEVRRAVMVAADTPPEVCMFPLSWMATVGNRGWAHDLTSYMKRDKLDGAEFHPGIMDGLTYKGKVLALSDDWETQLMFFNKDMFDRAGIKPLDANYTYDQWLDVARKLTTKTGDVNTAVWGGSMEPTWQTVMDTVRAWGGEVLTPDGTRAVVNSPEAVAAIQWIADSWNRHGVVVSPAETTELKQNWRQLFQTGRVAMGTAGVWVAVGSGGFLNTAKGINWQLAPKPKGPKTRGNTLSQNAHVLVTRSKNPEGGWLWMQFLNSKESWDARGGDLDQIPARKSLFDHPRIKAQAWLNERGIHQARKDSLATMKGQPVSSNFQEVDAEIRKAYGFVWRGEKSAKQAMDEVVPVANALLAKPL